MPIFFLLSGLGLVFLSYVLVSFWKEGSRTKGSAARHAMNRERPRSFGAIIVTHPISRMAHGGITVIPVRALVKQIRGKPVRRPRMNQVVEMPLKGMPINSTAEDLPRRAKIAAKDGP